MVRLPQNKNQTHRLNALPQMGSSGLTLAMTLSDLEFSRQIWNLLYLSQKWSNWQETKSKHIDWTLGLKWDHRVWPWPWPWPWVFKVKSGICYISTKNGSIATKQKPNTSIEWFASNGIIGFDLGHDLEFSRQIWNLLYLSQKWSNWQETKSKHIDWTLGLKWDHRVWPWPWPWIFKVKSGICYISTKNGSIATKQKPNTLIEWFASNGIIGFDLGHDLEFSRQIWNLLYLSQKWCNWQETKSKHIDWTLGLKWDHRVWPWPWTWPWIFKVKSGICYISAKNGSIAMKQKANILIER